MAYLSGLHECNSLTLDVTYEQMEISLSNTTKELLEMNGNVEDQTIVALALTERENKNALVLKELNMEATWRPNRVQEHSSAAKKPKFQ